MQPGAVSGQFNGPGADVALQRRLLAVPAANTVNVYSLTTHTLLTVLRGHQKPVSAARFAGEGDSQLLTASADGTLCIWDVEAGALSRNIAVGQPIVSLAAPAGGDVVHLSLAWKDRGVGRVRFCRLPDGQMLQPAIRLSAPTPLAAGRDLVATHDGHRVLVWAAAPGAAVAPLALHHTKPFKCVAVSPAGDRVAAGDATGRILIWYNVAPAVAAAAAAGPGEPAQQLSFGQRQRQQQQDAAGSAAAAAAPVATTVHWHAHAVRALAFSLDALRLLSGGDEAVLVTWRLADNSRSFLAHLGAPLTAVLPADEADAAYVVARADNAICQVSTATGAATDIAAGALPPPAPGPDGALPPPPPVGRPTGGSGAAAGGRVLAFAGAGAVLQLYDAAAGRSLARLQVGQQAPAVVGGRQGPGAALQHVAFSSDGALLVTVDARQDAGSSVTAATFLRFWRAADTGAGVTSAAAPSFVLQAAVEAPHGSGQVSGLALRPAQQLAATCGGDGAVRLWAPVVGRGGANIATAWHCQASWTRRGSPASRLAFSPDGSLLAAATPGAVALWDTAAGALAAALPHPPTAIGTAAAATHLVFAGTGPFLIAAVPEGKGTTRLTAWNLLTLGVTWSAALPLAALAADPSADGGGSLVAAVHGRRGSQWKDAVLRLDPATGCVVGAWQATPPVAHLVAVGSGTQQALLAVTADRAHEVVAAAGAEQEAGAPAPAAPVAEQRRPNALEAAFGATAAPPAAAAAPAPQVDHAANAVAASKRLFNRPSHLLRPAPEMAREFLLGLLNGRQTAGGG